MQAETDNFAARNFGEGTLSPARHESQNCTAASPSLDQVRGFGSRPQPRVAARSSPAMTRVMEFPQICLCLRDTATQARWRVHRVWKGSVRFGHTGPPRRAFARRSPRERGEKDAAVRWRRGRFFSRRKRAPDGCPSLGSLRDPRRGWHI